MKALRIQIVEDKNYYSRVLAKELEHAGYQVVSRDASLRVAQESFIQHQPDLAFVDIRLKENESNEDGILFATWLKTKRPIPVIYLTAYGDEETRFKARMAGPVNFIMKPYVLEQVLAAIELAADNFNNKSIHTPAAPSALKDIYFIKEGKTHQRVDLNSIGWIAADGNYCKVGMSDKDHLYSMTMKRFAEQLNNLILFKIHNSWTVNLEKIQGFDNEEVMVRVGERVKKVPIGPSFRKGFKEAINGLGT